MDDLILHALEAVGYHVAPTVENLVQCFRDFVDAGIWHNLHLQDGHVYYDNGGELSSIKAMAKGLLKIGR